MLGALGLLFVAITTEVIGTAALPRANGFRDPLWSAVVVGSYVVSTWLLSLVVRHLPVSTVYAIWAGVGTAAIAAIGVLYLGEQLTLMKVAAIAMIVVGVVVLNLQGAH
ncbi:QacE family quaternary ammonium compound efflux SMR transporter [Nocardioides baekrokdamisoli]|uniref:QacE family quaternary ammonium compound efflux SMR transporter n=1 Tax=Nocardioides baekrokdamisoli TaxID=1804624 RepID=A0A3G9IBZ6_9ACTN|nr:multidrug efflux SMR transporter [Nocardioides baekrokdamisoli]BBH16420.1 QacE family quaternary ammonium compound efflux SMR transporter [Nocardioides baekrokdamisoli]